MKRIYIGSALCVFLAATLPLNAAPLSWQTNGAVRSAVLNVAASGKAGFTLMTGATTGIAFTNQLPQWRHLTNQVLLNGGGVAFGDVDADGWCDVFLCNLTGASALYRNLGGWKFTNVAASAGVACDGLTASGVALVDFDGDGDLDLIVNTVGHGTRVFSNDGRGRFTEVARLNGTKAGMSLALGDLDGDGFLDLYVANYRTMALMDMPNTIFNFATRNGQRVIARVNGKPVTDPEFANRYRLNARGGIEENGEADEVYRNVGGKNFAPLAFTDGTFLDEAGRALAEPPFDWGLSVMMRDLNQDGLPDIWVISRKSCVARERERRNAGNERILDAFEAEDAGLLIQLHALALKERCGTVLAVHPAEPNLMNQRGPKIRRQRSGHVEGGSPQLRRAERRPRTLTLFSAVMVAVAREQMVAGRHLLIQSQRDLIGVEGRNRRRSVRVARCVRQRDVLIEEQRLR